MKYFYFLFALLSLSNVQSQIINIPDANFKNKLLEASPSNIIAFNASGANIKIDTNNDGEIQLNEAWQVKKLNLNDSNITSLQGIKSFGFLQYLRCDGNNLTVLDLSGMNHLSTLHCEYLAGSPDNTIYPLQHINVNDCAMLNQLIYNHGNLITVSANNCTNMSKLACVGNQITSLSIVGATALTELSVAFNNLTAIDLSSATSLVVLFCRNNQLTQIDLHDNLLLESFQCESNLLTELDVTMLSNLFMFKCDGNQLTSLDLSNHPSLTYFSCVSNQLTELNIDNSTFFDFDISDNELSSINEYSLRNVGEFRCMNNNFTSLDLNLCKNLYELNVDGNPLVNLFIKNGRAYPPSYNFNCETLKYLCVDVSNIEYFQFNLDYYGLSETCMIGDYCNFNPGGTFYTISGNNKFDLDMNGCSATDNALPYLKFNISNGITSGTIISDQSGFYSFAVGYGNQTVTPIIENPSYFTISPPALTVNFPASTSPSLQDFCIAPNGIHHDLSVNLLPSGAAVPGFNANYRVIVKNEGNQIASGTVNLTFDDSVLDFVSASEGTASGNMVSIPFSDFEPFESRTYVVTLNLNSPMETPALNNGDVLNFTASISTTDIDETPANNIAILNQTVLNSMDPNHKTCAQGQTITPSMVGQFVNYIIEFENLGTFAATNVVVKDRIDATKFDVETLVPIAASHDFVTRITDTNKVEFIFENINLPFDDANNDGFVAFKIKTKPTLVLGDTFSNTAAIYFDYNFPIITNTETTTIAALGKQDFEFGSFITLYPNPTRGILHLKKSAAISVSSIGIYNMLGQQLIVIPNANSIESVDVSSLVVGNYFLKIQSDKGTSIAKFVKQ